MKRQITSAQIEGPYIRYTLDDGSSFKIEKNMRLNIEDGPQWPTYLLAVILGTMAAMGIVWVMR